MKRHQIISSALKLCSEVLLALVPAVMFYYTYTHYYYEANFYSKGNRLFFVVYLALLVLFTSIYSGFNIRKFRTRELVFAFGLSSLFTDIITYFIMCMIAQQMLRPWATVITLAIQWVVETGLYVVLRILADRIEPVIPVLLLSPAGEKRSVVMTKFDERRTRYRVDRILSPALPWEELTREMDRYNAVFIENTEDVLRHKLMDYCFWHGIQVLLKPNMNDIMINCGETTIMSDMLLYDIHTGHPDRGYLAAKRALDVAASLCGLILCSPILIGAAIAVKAQDGGPVFYRQKRLTKNGKPFMLTKFRSMVVNAEKGTGAVLAGKTDSRITKVGAFLRATRIDELPQLFNILNGEMTLVGPRPERPEFYEKYCAEYPEFAYRLRAKAGLTGYAQLYGKYNTTFEDKALLDMSYIQKASFLWDIQLIFYTLKIIFVKESTEGVSEEPGEQGSISAGEKKTADML